MEAPLPASAPSVSIVILNWNGKDWLEKFLPSVVATQYAPIEILVVDNGSTDESIAFVSTHYPLIRLVELGQNYGFAQGNNLALPHIHTPYLVLLNSDVELSPGWLSPLVALAESDPKIAAIQPKVLAYHQKTHFEYAGASGGYLDAFAYPFCRGRIFDTLEADQGQYDEVQDISWATGACCFIRKSVVDQIGLFEADFFAHMEEIDFCWRAQNHGYRLCVEPRSVVYHVGGGTLPQGSPRKTFLNVRNSLAMMLKNLPAGQVAAKLLVRLLLDGVWGIKMLLEGKGNTLFAIVKGHWHFFAKIPFWYRRRKEIYPQSPPPLRAGYLKGSIVWQYFAKNKKHWDQLTGL